MLPTSGSNLGLNSSSVELSGGREEIGSVTPS